MKLYLKQMMNFQGLKYKEFQDINKYKGCNNQVWTINNGVEANFVMDFAKGREFYRRSCVTI